MNPTITHDPSWEIDTLVNGRDHQKYYKSDGTLVPGVTTVLGVLAKNQLINWAAKVEREGIVNCYNKGEAIPEKLFYATKRDTAGDVGTITHFIAQCYITNKNPSFQGFEEESINKAFVSFQKFKSFWDERGYKCIHSELQLVSEKHSYGGTLDVVFVDRENDHSLLDLKTSSGIYGDHISQLAAYENLYNETHKDPINKRSIIRLGKEDINDFEIKDISNYIIQAHWNRFKSALNIYQCDKEIKALDKVK